MFFLYEALLYLVFILLFPAFLVVGFMRGKYLSNFRERFGSYRHPAGAHDLWIHAVSVGEVMAAKTIFERILTKRPSISAVITTTTITGQQMARRIFKGATITYFPFDFSIAVNRFLDHHRPGMLVLVETEIWPNVTRICGERKIPLMIVNGRISDRSFPKYQKARFILRRLLRHYDAIVVRETVDRERFVAMGAEPEQIEVAGNVKFDFEPDSTPLPIAAELETMRRGRPMIVFGSTVEREDEALVPFVQRLIEEHGCFVVIAPRKPERFELVAGLLSTAGLRFVRRSEWEHASRAADVLLLDTIGELARIYWRAHAAFVGGSLFAGTGGHNPIEPAACGTPVSFGPHMSNFREIAATFLDAGAARQVDSPEELYAFVRELLTDAARHAEMKQAATEAVARSRGAAERIATRIVEILP